MLLNCLPLKRILYHGRRARPGGCFSLREACGGGSSLVLPRPAPRERSAALEARCAELRRRLEQRQYDALVHDITQPVRSLRVQHQLSYKAFILRRAAPESAAAALLEHYTTGACTPEATVCAEAEAGKVTASPYSLQ